ncbi:MAG: hypothetical protein [Olavius algarvensis Gamma 3 endosymbiont]|nr:MAG: hypothetical protein [Olavius algarvensis Gamma 3 endosymbiont]
MVFSRRRDVPPFFDDCKSLKNEGETKIQFSFLRVPTIQDELFGASLDFLSLDLGQAN